MFQKAEILIVSPESGVREAIKGYLSTNGYRIHSFSTIMEALGLSSKKKFDLLILDQPKSEVGNLLSELRGLQSSAGLILVAETIADAAALNKLSGGADGCLFKPVREAEVRFEINRVIAQAMTDRTSAPKSEAQYVHYDSRNPRMAELYDAAVSKIAKSDSTVLIVGESGTGKELMAYWIYANSLRRNKPFVKVSCAVLPEGVLESELFGHEKGAFTGAYAKRRGRFEIADGGTIFLDEIGEIPPSIQAKFLRVLQEREFQRVGSNQPIKVDVRIIAATSRNLKKEVEEGHFRDDLYYRLNVITIPIPPLRERKEDIPFLAQMFIRKFAKSAKKEVVHIDEKAMKLLTAYDWPGNIRELENAMEWSVVMASKETLTIDDLPVNIIQQLGDEPPVEMSLREARELFEREYICDTLVRFQGNVSRSSRYLGLARKNLQEKIKKYEIRADKYR